MFNILKNSKKYNFIYCECNSLDDLNESIKTFNPNCIIYNYTEGLMPWAKNIKTKYPNIQHLALCHDVVQQEIDLGYKIDGFDFRIALDPTLKTNSKWFTSVRPLFGYALKNSSRNKIPTIGSFGFYFPHKNFAQLINIVKQQYEKAIIRLHITKAHFSSDGTKNEFDKFKIWAKETLEKTQIQLYITSEYISDQQQINFLSENDVNIFLYSQNFGMGPSSAIDYAVAAGKPIIISESYQFNHVKTKLPSIINTNIQHAIDSGNSNVLELQNEWSEDNFLKNYEGIIYEVQNRKK
jgi:hypothetical protein